MKTWIQTALIGGTLCMASPLFAQTKKSSIKYIDAANMNKAVKPGDNFYLYANGTWLKNNPVPASKTRWGSFDLLRETSLSRLKKLCEDAAAGKITDSVAQRVGALYASAMDSAAIEKAGATPIQPELQRLATLSTKDQVLHEIIAQRQKGVNGLLFGFYITQDDKNVNLYIPALSQGGTSLPDRDYYLKTDSRSKTIQAAYLSYLKDMFVLTGDDSVAANTKAHNIYNLEKALAIAQMSRVDMRDPQKTYNKFSLADLSKTTPDFDWTVLMKELNVNSADSILVNNPDFLKTANSLFDAVPVDTWKAYLQWAVIKSAAPYLSNAFVNRQFQFGQVLSGQKQITPRWQRMSSMVDNNLGESLGQLYVKQYFNDSAKQRMISLVKNIQSTFRDRINNVDWMTDSTKKAALGKLDAIVNKIAFPDKWEAYPGVVVTKNDVLQNLQNIDEFEYTKMVNKMGKPVDKTEWGMTPPTINAYYNPSNNEIAFPAGILQFPFFDFGADDAVNYGGIAAVIGHELTHGFDDEGRQYAADGNLKEWWTKEDEKKFTERADKVAAQYDAFTVNDSLHVNGKLTLGENLADLGGLNIAYQAFKNTPEGKSDKMVDGFTPDQRFFLSWAQVWRANITPEYAAQLVVVDPHSPGMYRCNGPVSNIDAWYKAFDVKQGDAMYKPEEARIKVW